jgi:quercetin dioxygenase-like cupin family protein
MLPFDEKQISDNVFVRKFSKDLSDDELYWHKDKEDRFIRVISGDNWFFQIDNELPILMSKGSDIFIPQKTWHRIVRGNSDLIIEIIKL